MSDLKEQLLAKRGGVETVDVELELGTVRVRGLTRGEVFAVNKVARKVRDDEGNLEADTEDLEAHLVARGLVEPTMTVDEARTWQRNSPAGEIERVVAKIQQLSGLAKGADKESYKSVGDRSDAGVRDVPGDAAEADGGPAAGADE